MAKENENVWKKMKKGEENNEEMSTWRNERNEGGVMAMKSSQYCVIVMYQWKAINPYEREMTNDNEEKWLININENEETMILVIWKYNDY